MGFLGRWGNYACPQCRLVTLSLSEAEPGRFGRQLSFKDLYDTIPSLVLTRAYMYMHTTHTLMNTGPGPSRLRIWPTENNTEADGAFPGVGSFHLSCAHSGTGPCIYLS